MNKKLVQNLDDMTFYLTVEDPCSYLEGKTERKIFTKLDGKNASNYFDLLSQRGFRRSQNIAYIPACKDCHACKSSRLVVDEFELSKSQKRVVNKNKNLVRKICQPYPTSQQFKLFKKYIKARHGDGEMSEMGVVDYAKMIAETNVNTKIIEYRTADNNQLVAAVLTDIMSDGLSMVYSFFDPDFEKSSIGTYLILDHIEYAYEAGLPYVYLGYYIKDCGNMAYKDKFAPQERYDGNEWQLIEH